MKNLCFPCFCVDLFVPIWAGPFYKGIGINRAQFRKAAGMREICAILWARSLDRMTQRAQIGTDEPEGRHWHLNARGGHPSQQGSQRCVSVHACRLAPDLMDLMPPHPARTGHAEARAGAESPWEQATAGCDGGASSHPSTGRLAGPRGVRGAKLWHAAVLERDECEGQRFSLQTSRKR